MPINLYNNSTYQGDTITDKIQNRLAELNKANPFSFSNNVFKTVKDIGGSVVQPVNNTDNSSTLSVYYTGDTIQNKIQNRLNELNGQVNPLNELNGQVNPFTLPNVPKIKQGVLANYPQALKETAISGLKAIPKMFFPAITNFVKKSTGIIGESLAYAIDPLVREQYKAGNQDILPNVSATSPTDMLKNTFAAGLEASIYKIIPSTLKRSIMKRFGVGALQGVGLAVSQGLANDETPEQILDNAKTYGKYGAAIEVVVPYLLPLLKTELKNIPQGVKSAFKGLVEETSKVPVGLSIEDVGNKPEFYKLAKGKESISPIAKNKVFQSMPDKEGYEKVYMPYGEQGKGSYYSPIKSVGEVKPLAQEAKPVFSDLTANVLKKFKAEELVKIYPVINLKNTVPITDIYGIKKVIPAGEALTPYELKGNKYLLKDGGEHIVSKNQYQNIRGQSVKAEAVEFAPELKGTEETILGKQPGDAKKAMEITKKAFADFDAGKITREERNRILDTTNDIVPQDKSKFSQYQLPGGKNYREIIVKAPTEKSIITNWNDLGGGNYDAVVNGRKISIVNEGERFYVYEKDGQLGQTARTIEDAKRIAESYVTKKPVGFKSSHYPDETNPLFHLRVKEYDTKPYGQVTFIEELQSDWAASGRKYGFADINTKKPLDLDEWLTENNKIYNRQNQQEYEVYNRSFKEQGKEPFNPLLKNWQELSIKRALKEAVDNNSEYLSWVNGEQTSARYSLSKQVDKIVWNKNDKKLTAFFDGKKVIDKSGVAEKDLSSYIGKDASRKIIDKSNIGEPNRGGKEYADFFSSNLPTSVKLTSADNSMLSVLHHNEIRNSVISNLPIDVMNVLKTLKISPENLLSDKSVVATILTRDKGLPVIKGVVSTLSDIHTKLRTKLLSGYSAGVDISLLPTLKASNMTSSEVLSLAFPDSFHHFRKAEGIGELRPTTSGAKASFVNNSGKTVTATPADFMEWHKKIIAGNKPISQDVFIEGKELEVSPEWAKNLYDKQVKNIVEDLTGHRVEVIDMGLPIDNKVPAFDLIQPSGKRIAKLTPDNLEVGASVSNAKGDYYIITNILGDGKFKAVPKNVFKGYTTSEIQQAIKNQKGIIYDKISTQSETFDISTKKSAGQQAIKITPDIRAKVKGEAPTLKQPSGASPFGKAQIGPMAGIGAGSTGVLATLAALKGKNKEVNAKTYAEKIASIKMPTSKELVPGETEYNVVTKERKYKPLPGELKSATLTVYNPKKEQTDESPDTGGFLTKMEFGDVAVGNRNEYDKAKSKFLKDKTDTFIFIPELEKVKTPYGDGIFRVRDTMKITNDGKNMLDVFIPNAGSEVEKTVRNTPKANYTYLKI